VVVSKPARTKIPGRGNRTLRLVDRFAGIPLVALMGGLRRKRRMPGQMNRIGILSTAAIGDTILSGAVVSDLRSAFPSSSIIYFAGDTNYSTALLLPATDSVIRVPVYHPLEASRIVRSRNLDLLIDLGPWPRLNAVIARLSGARFTVGFRTPGQYRHYAYDLAIEHSSAVHELENHRRIVTRLGIEANHLPMIDSRMVPAKSALAPSAPYLLFHLWPGGTCSREKEWPTERWIQLAIQFAAKGYAIVLSGARSQHRTNHDVIEVLPPRYRALIRNAAGLSLAETAALASNARLVVSVDTGIMHLAAVLGVPVIGLHGPASSKRWGPIGRNAVAIDSPDPRAGYLYLGFELPADPPRCMEAISYERVLSECMKMLDDAASDRLQVNAGQRYVV
jgi:ADP-heptose:LPS heptosyltransferase